MLVLARAVYSISFEEWWIVNYISYVHSCCWHWQLLAACTPCRLHIPSQPFLQIRVAPLVFFTSVMAHPQSTYRGRGEIEGVYLPPTARAYTTTLLVMVMAKPNVGKKVAIASLCTLSFVDVTGICTVFCSPLLCSPIIRRLRTVYLYRHQKRGSVIYNAGHCRYG